MDGRRSGREKEKYGGFEKTGERFLIKHGSSQFHYQRHSRQDTIGFIYFYRVSLSLRAHYSFPFTPPCTLIFSFFVPRLLSPLPSPINRSRPFESFMTETDVYKERKKSDASGKSEEMKHKAFAKLRKGNGRNDRCSRANEPPLPWFEHETAITELIHTCYMRARSNIHGRF